MNFDHNIRWMASLRSVGVKGSPLGVEAAIVFRVSMSIIQILRHIGYNTQLQILLSSST